MRKTALAQWIFNFVALAIIALALVGLLWLFAKAIDKGATVLAGTLAGLATVGAAVIVRYFERKKEGEAARREHLGPLYERMAATLAGHSMTDRATIKLITDLERKMLIHATPGALGAFRAWRWNIPSEEAPLDEQQATLLRYEALVKAMRKDVGSSNFGLEEGDLVRTMVPDFDTSLPQGRASLEPPDGEPRVFDNTRRSRTP